MNLHIERLRAPRSRLAPVAAGLLAVMIIGAAGCQGGDRRAVDEHLVLALEEARAHQHRADVFLDGGDVASAITEVRAVLAVAFPVGTAEGEEARLDAHARLAKLLATQGDETEALAEIERGRKEATVDSFYRAHLETVAGEILEARGKRLAATDATAGRAAQRDALDAYSRSIDINKRVQARLLKEAP